MPDVIQLPLPMPSEPNRRLVRPDEFLNDLIPGGDDLTHRVRFSADQWNLAGHPTWRDKAGSQVVIDFQRISTRWRDAAKELALLQLHPALAAERVPDVPMAAAWPSIQEPIAPVTAQGNIKMLAHALGIVEQQGLTQFDADDWERLPVLLVQPASTKEKQSGATLSPATGKGRAQQLVALWQVCQITGREALLGTGVPFSGRAVNELFARRSGRNAVRPHEAVGHVLGFTAWFFDHCADDIVSHIEWWAQHASREPLLSEEARFDAMLDLCARIADENNGVLPASVNAKGGITVAAAPLARLLGIFDADQAYLAGRWAKSQLRDTVSYSLSMSPCPLPITLVPNLDGEMVPWTERLIASKESLDAWQRRLVYYAMYYLSATVMLRDSQLAVLPFDPLKTEEIARPDGSRYTRHTLSAFKTKNRHADVPTTVVVNARIARIVGLLHRLQQALGYEPRRSERSGMTYLFDQLLVTPLGKTPRVDARDGLYLDQWFLTVIREGADDLYRQGVIARDLSDIHLSMRQVRITCAQAYAVREHGQALAAAFGQWDTAAVTAGYIGDVYRLITPLEPEETRELAQEDIGRRVKFLADHRDELTGNGRARLDDALERTGAVLSNPQPLTPARLKSIGKMNPNIEQGPLSLCVYQPEGALCGGRGKADFRLCAPGQCRNSVMTRADRARYELMRRQQVAIGSPRSLAAANDMHDRNPQIAAEFDATPDADLHAIITEHLDNYIRAALEAKS